MGKVGAPNFERFFALRAKIWLFPAILPNLIYRIAILLNDLFSEINFSESDLPNDLFTEIGFSTFILPNVIFTKNKIF